MRCIWKVGRGLGGYTEEGSWGMIRDIGRWSKVRLRSNREVHCRRGEC